MTSDGTTSGATGGLLAPFGLIRRRDERQLAGVCAALARASGTDPLLWRAGMGVLVVFAGTGLLLYVVGWLLFPTDGDEVSAVGGLFRRGRSSTGIIATLALLAAAVVLTVIVLLNQATYPVVSLGAAVMLLAALTKNRPPPEAESTPSSPPDEGAYRAPFAPKGPYTRTRELPASVAPEPVTVEIPVAEQTPVVSPAAEQPTVELPAEPATEEIPMVGSAPAVQERSGAAEPPRPSTGPIRPSWSSDPAAETAMAPVRRRDSGLLNLIGFSLVGLAMGVMLIVALSDVAVPVMAFEGVALLIVGLVVMVGTWWGRGRSLIAFGVALSLVICVHYLAFGERLDGPLNTSVAATTVDEIPQNWSVQMYESDLNLRGVAFEDSGPVELGAIVQAGGARIFVPQEVDLYISVDVTGGEVVLVESHDKTSVAGLRAVSVLTSDGPDGPGGGELRIDLVVEFGYLEVIRE